MKTSTHKCCILLIVMNIAYFGLHAQTIKTVGGAGANYSTLKLAFDAINTGSIRGNIILQITGSTTETASATLYQSGYTATGANSSYTSITIYPTSSGYSISGNIAVPIIYLNGATNVTFDGRVNAQGSTASLSIINSNTTTNAVLIRYINSAQLNSVRYCNLFGSGNNGGTGLLYFTASTTGNGNSSNVIEYSNISSYGGNRPVNALFSSGTSGHENINNIIRYNNFYDIFNASSSSNGICISYASSDWIISNNSFYETSAFAPTGSYKYYHIFLNTGNNHLISNNYFGGTTSQCGGSAMIISSNMTHYYSPMFINGGTTNKSTVQSNTVQNLNYTSTNSNPWDGIYINSGNVDVIGNTIGSPTGNSSIIVNTPVAYATSTITNGVVTAINIIGGGSGYTVAPVISFSVNNGGTGVAAQAELTNGVITKIDILNGGSGYTSAPSVYFDGQTNMYSTSHGMIQNSSGTVNILNNNIGSITTYGLSTYSHGWESVYVRSVTGTTTFDGNLIGSLTTPNSIQTGSTCESSIQKLDVYGIYSSSVGTTIIKNNTVANLTNHYAGTNSGSRTRGIATIAGQNTIQNNTVRNISSFSGQTSNYTSAPVIGIAQTSSTAGTTQTVADNFVNNISSSHASALVAVYGIFYVGPTTGNNTVSDNFVHSISALSTNTLTEVDGIVLNWGVTNTYNNIVNLGAGISTGYKLNGIVDATNTNNTSNIYFNSVYLSGTVSGATSATACFYNTPSGTTGIYENNIFFNARSGGTSNKHYAAILAGNTSVVLNYNDYFVSGSNSVLMKFGGNDETTLAAIKTATTKDANSLSVNPLFTNAGSTNPLDYNTGATLTGLSISGISNDYDDLARKNPPRMGALESNNYVWNGTVSTDFGTAANWAGGIVPPNGADISFSATPQRNCVLDQNRSLEDITNSQGTYKFVLNGKQLTLTGSLIFSNGAQLDATIAASTVSFAGSVAQNISAGSFVNNSIDTLKINNIHGFSLNTDFTIQKGIALIAGNFAIGTNTLTFNGIVTAMTGTVSGGTSTNMIIGGSGSIINMPDFTLNNLTINRASGVSLYGNLNIAGTLTLANGTMSINANSLTISGNSPTRVNGNIDASNPLAHVIFSNSSAITLPASFFINPVNNLTVSGAGGLTSSGDFSINGILNLLAANPSPVKGILDFGLNTLTMGANATTAGTGDMTGIIKRTSFTANTAYTFGNQFTSMTFSAGGTMPTDMSFNIAIGSAPGWKSSAVQRYIDIKRTGGANTTVTLVLHYLASELQTNTETNLIVWDYHSSIPKVEEHGKSNQDMNEEWIAISNRSVTYFDTTFGTHKWGISNKESANFVWQGTPSSEWNDPNNWSGGIVPTSTSDVVIPDATTTVHRPTLNTSSTVKTIIIQPNGILDGGNATTLTISGSSGAWLNLGTFNPGTSNVIFTNANATMADPTNFYNLTIANGASLTLGTDNIMRIAGELLLQGTGILRAALLPNTVEFNGTNQTIINANGLTQGFYNLILSGTGTKTMPDTELNIAGNLTITGTTTAIVDSIININGNLTVEQDATLDLNDYNHLISGNIICNGLLTTSTTAGSVTLNGNCIQSIDGTNKEQDAVFYNLNIKNVMGTVINKDVTVKNNMTIDASSKLTINPACKVNVLNQINNAAGTAGIYIKSSETLPNGSLMFHNASNLPVNATVELYSKANWNLNNVAGSKYQWQYFGIPVKSVKLDNVFSNCYVRKWNETGITDVDLWNMQYSSNTLTPFTGYELVQSNPTTYTFTGQLENSDYTSSMTYTSGAVFPGQHIFANPYTAAIDISKIQFGSNTEASVYLFNTGNYNDWLYNEGHTKPGNNSGQYTVATPQTAGFGGIPGQIPSMQGFLVKTLNNSGTITIPYSAACQNAEMLRVKGLVEPATQSKVFTKVEVNGKYSSDCMWIFTDKNCKHGFDNGWDGTKIPGAATTSQVFAMEPDGNYQIAAVDDLTETYLGFSAGQDYDYTLKFTHQNIESKYQNLYLIDLANNNCLDITANGSEYHFQAISTPNAVKRFKIISSKPGDIQSQSALQVLQQQGNLLIQNGSESKGELYIYSLSGIMVQKQNFAANSLSLLNTEQMEKGIYIVKASTSTEKITQKILIH